jgi:hypothetical protein
VKGESEVKGEERRSEGRVRTFIDRLWCNDNDVPSVSGGGLIHNEIRLRPTRRRGPQTCAAES